MSDKSEILNTLGGYVNACMPRISELFARDENRAARFTFTGPGMLADFSKQRMAPDVHGHLLSLLSACNFEKQRKKFFAGANINFTEGRAVLHPALRGSGGSADQQKQVKAMQARMRRFANGIRKDGKIKAIVHIGIGGSDLGPQLYADAMAASAEKPITLRFAENVDGASINDALKGLRPASTLVVSVSKSFTTQETRMNTEAAAKWLGKHASANMIAVTANLDGALAMGLRKSKIFEFWDWVGGRYSVWSAVGLSLQIAFGPKLFAKFLKGAADMDAHFREVEPENNLPVMLALTAYWNRNFLDYATQAVIPYARRLRVLPSFLQQLEMESNGKSVSRGGEAAPLTSPIVWGSEGTNGQHAYFQFLHQGTEGAPVDFIAVLEDMGGRPDHHRALLANCFAQSEALMLGKTEEAVRADLKASGLSKSKIDKLAPHKTFPGNRPSTTIVLERMDAYTLGSLIALYEHKTFTLGVLWDINAFDQWGVELGKVLAGTILSELETDSEISGHDGSTAALIGLARAAAKD